MRRFFFLSSILLSLAASNAAATSMCYEWRSNIVTNNAWWSSAADAAKARADWCTANNHICGASSGTCSATRICTTTVSLLEVNSFPAHKVVFRVDSLNTLNGATTTSYTTGATMTYRQNPAGCQVFTSAVPPTPAQCPTCNEVAGSINPANGSVYKSEADASASSGAPSFNRSYNSTDAGSVNLGAGWRHSFSGSIKPRNSGSTYKAYVASPDNSTPFNTEALACTSGFAQIKSRVSAWSAATATYANGSCNLSVGATSIGTLPLFYTSPPTPAPGSTTVIAYDVTRDDGQQISFGVNGSSIVAPPSITFKLQKTVNGYVLTDARDNVETYDNNGRLLSIASRSGVLQTLAYDASQRLSAVTDSFGRVLSLGYDPTNRLTSVTTGGLTTNYGYDAQSRLSTATQPDGTTRTYLYESAGLPTALTGLMDENNVRHATWAYDAQGRALSTTLAGGAGATSLTYNTDSSVTVADALNAARAFSFARVGDRLLTKGITGSQCPTCREGKSTSYDLAGFVSSRADYNDVIATYTNDPARGLETSRTEASATPQAKTTSTQWHPTYRVPTQIDEPGKRTTFTHDANGNVLTRTELDTTTSTSRTSTYTYNTFGQVLTVNGPRTDVSDITTFTYYNCITGYQCGQVQTVTNALNQTTTYNTYNAHGQPLTMTDPNGVVTTLVYDARQRLMSRTVGTEVTTMQYWPTSLLKKVTLPASTYIDYTYDAAHRLIGINDSEGNRIAYTLDAMGNRTAESVYDPLNALTTTRSRVFNTLSRLSQELTASASPSEATSFAYDNNGNQTTVSAPLGRNSTNVYDELNRLKQVTDPGAGVTQYGYNALDQLISVTDPRNKVTNYTYNALGDLTQQVSPDTGTTTNTFDSAGNLKTSTDSRNKTATYTYDVLNRVTQVSYPDQSIVYHYDLGVNGKGRLSDVTDNSGQTQWSYDSQGRVTSRSQTTTGVFKQLSYGYDGSGRLSTVTLPSGHFVQYGYTNGKVTSLTLDGSTPILNSVLYEPFGPTRGWTWGNNTLAVRDFDQDGKVTLIDSAGLKTYGYDNAFRITGITDANDATKSQSYGYDSLDRLTTITGTALNDSFTYEANGNRLTQGGNQSSTYAVSSTNNRVNSITGTLTKTYTYDNAGNTLSDGTRTYTYNDAGRMISATNVGITTAYTYNALGQRVKKTNSAATRYFVYDEAGHLTGEYDGGGALVQEIIWFGDTPVATLRPNGGGVELFYIHTDHLSTPRRITKPSTNQIVWRWDSDAFGTTMANENPSGVGVFAFNLRFPGQYFDTETGSHYNYFRDYDPATGRYSKSDPIGLDGGLNTYAYVGANPLLWSDPLGLERIYSKDGITFYAYGKPQGGSNVGEHARHGEGGEYHVHVNGDPNKRWDVYNNRPLTDSEKFTRKELKICENLGDEERAYLKRATREVFHHNVDNAKKAYMNLLKRTSKKALGVVGALAMYAESNSHMEACAVDVAGQVPFCD